MIIKCVFVWLNESVLTSHEVLAIVNSALIVSSSSCGLLEDTKTLVSSANNLKESFSEEFEISFIYRVETTMAQV